MMNPSLILFVFPIFYIMKPIIRLLPALIAGALVSHTANAGFLDAAIETLPGANRTSEGFFSAQWEGIKDLYNNGNTGVVVGLYTNHPGWEYHNRKEENGFPWGGGLVRGYIDENNNERMLFAFAFSDSHYKIEPIIGYSWVHRWDLYGPLHVGAGYILGLTFRADYQWLPIPTPLPVLSAGVGNVDTYMTFIPGSNVFFFYSSIKTDDHVSRTIPLPASSRFAKRNEVYAAAMWEKTDSATEKGYTITSDAGGLVGVRRFINDAVALEFNATQSKHDTKANGVKDRRWKQHSYNLAAQYHMRFSESWRAHAGLGIGYSVLKESGGGQKESSVHPTVQAGATWAPTEHTRVMGGINMIFPRYSDIAPSGDVKFRPSPVQLYLGAGFAF